MATIAVFITCNNFNPPTAMRQRLLILLRIWAVFMLLFIVGKLGFMAYQHAFLKGASAADVAGAVWYGLPLDLATTGYLSTLPWLLLAVSIWVPAWQRALRTIYMVYATLMAVALALILISDACLYSFWEFKLDATVFAYLDSPQAITQSVSPLYLLIGLMLVAAVAMAAAWALRRAWSARPLTPCRRGLTTGLFIILGGLTFLSIRGGVGRSTANVGMVYHSSRPFFNHAAVNPAFSLFYSSLKQQDFGRQCDYFSEPRRATLFAGLQKPAFATPAPRLTTRRPNIVIIIMEGLGSTFVGPLGGNPDITPHMNHLSREGLFFTQCYANSFRTDRGTLSILSGYPAFPTASVMKLPEKTRHLPGIAASLRQAGYATTFLYGGDINFTNMNSYLMSTGYQTTLGDTDFPLAERRTHAWGVTDSITFNRLYDMIMERQNSPQPWHIGFLTLASHEPWKVPYHRLPHDEKANAMAYLDHCLGRLVNRLRQTPAWRNLLLICLPDHGIVYPDGMSEANPAMSHIPMLWLGGAVRSPERIDAICSQSDLAATLLGQLGLPHSAYRFSRDVLSSSYTYPFAVHTWAGGFSFIDSTGHTIFDLASQRVLTDAPHPSALRLDRAKAYLQTCYDDLQAL